MTQDNFVQQLSLDGEAALQLSVIGRAYNLILDSRPSKKQRASADNVLQLAGDAYTRMWQNTWEVSRFITVCSGSISCVESDFSINLESYQVDARGLRTQLKKILSILEDLGGSDAQLKKLRKRFQRSQKDASESLAKIPQGGALCGF